MRFLFLELKSWWDEYFAKTPRLPAFALLLATVLIILCELYGSSGFYRREIAFDLGGFGKELSLSRLMPHLYWFSASFFFYGLIPILFLLVSKKKLSDFGITFGDWRKGFLFLGLFVAVIVPTVILMLQTKSFLTQYPFNKAALGGIGVFLFYESFYMLYFFAWEFFFRGFLLFALYEKLGNWAIWMQMIPFALLHIGKPAPEVLASVFAGLLLGAFALRTRSMLYCFLLHAIAAFTMDLGAFIAKGQWVW